MQFHDVSSAIARVHSGYVNEWRSASGDDDDDICRQRW